MSLIEFVVLAASLPATTYGWGEHMCGDIGTPKPCIAGAITASGEVFDPEIPSAAIPFTYERRLRARWIGLRVPGGECQRIRLNDKANPRWIGKRGFDLSPAAVALITQGQPAAYWSGKVELCNINSLLSPWWGYWQPQYPV
jgi:hypothetical protein